MLSPACFSHKDILVQVLRLSALALALLCLAPPSMAQTSLDEIERRIQQGKAKKAQEAAEQSKARSVNQGDQSRVATVVVQTDASCEFSVNGKRIRTLAQGITEVKVQGGQSLVSCSSTEVSGVAFEVELETRSGQSTVLRIQLASRVTQAQQQRQREAEKRDQLARQEKEFRAECDAGTPHLMGPGSTPGALRQCSTGLEWTQSDSGRDIDWNEAVNFCQSKDGGWGLPTVAQLQSLYKRELKGQVCWTDEGQAFQCKVSDKFRLTGTYFWSSERERKNSTEALVVDLSGGDKYAGSIDGGSYKRALCVRRL